MSATGENLVTKQKKLIKILKKGRIADCFNYNPWDEIIPGLFLGDAEIAKSIWKLQKGNITHILSTVYNIPPEKPTSFFALGIDQEFYHNRGLKVKFKGLPVLDDASFPIDHYFQETSEFIHSALKSNGRVLVHCILGRSRSATLVIAYLMIKQGMGVEDAVKLVSDKRSILPNSGFLRQLCQLNQHLHNSKRQ